MIVHYDGKLRVIADDIAQLDLDIDSLTPAPEDRGFKMGQSSFRKGFFWPTLLLPFLLLGHGARGRETGPNLLRNGDFEDVAAAEPIGWTKSGLGTWSMEPGRFGERCLKIAVGTPNQERAEIWARSSDFAVTPGNLYLLVFWAKGEGLKCAEGVSSHVSWEFRKADGQDLPMLQEWRTDIWESCCAGRWNVGDMIVKAPAEATSARLVVWLGAYQPKKKGSVCLDRIRVAGYDPPAPTETTWFYRAATYGIGGDQVDDPQAKTGQAWKMTVKKHQPGGKISGPLIMDQEPGLYRAVFRMKAADRTSPRRLAFLRVTGDGLVSTGLTAGRTINGTDFAEPNQYQEFAVEFIRSPFGGLQYLVEWSGGTDLWLDGVTIHQERLLLDLDLVRALWPRRRFGCNADDRSEGVCVPGTHRGPVAAGGCAGPLENSDRHDRLARHRLGRPTEDVAALPPTPRRTLRYEAACVDRYPCPEPGIHGPETGARFCGGRRRASGDGRLPFVRAGRPGEIAVGRSAAGASFADLRPGALSASGAIGTG